jgi:predicted Zn-dependent protease
MEMGKNREAIIYFAASTGLRPFPKVTFDLAKALLRGGHLGEAKRATERAIAALPHYASARALLAELEQMIALAREGDSPPATH